MATRHISRAIVHGGQVVLSGLGLPDGQRVEVMVTQLPEQQTRSISEVRQELRGAVVRYDDPFEPVIPGNDMRA